MRILTLSSVLISLIACNRPITRPRLETNLTSGERFQHEEDDSFGISINDFWRVRNYNLIHGTVKGWSSLYAAGSSLWHEVADLEVIYVPTGRANPGEILLITSRKSQDQFHIDFCCGKIVVHHSVGNERMHPISSEKAILLRKLVKDLLIEYSKPNPA